MINAIKSYFFSPPRETIPFQDLPKEVVMNIAQNLSASDKSSLRLAFAGQPRVTNSITAQQVAEFGKRVVAFFKFPARTSPVQNTLPEALNRVQAALVDGGAADKGSLSPLIQQFRLDESRISEEIRVLDEELELATRTNNTAAIPNLLTEAKNIGLSFKKYGAIYLKNAARNNNLELVKTLLKLGAIPNKFHPAPQTFAEIAFAPLMNPDLSFATSAISHDNQEMLELLIQAGASVDKNLYFELAIGGRHDWALPILEGAGVNPPRMNIRINQLILRLFG